MHQFGWISFLTTTKYFFSLFHSYSSSFVKNNRHKIRFYKFVSGFWKPQLTKARWIFDSANESLRTTIKASTVFTVCCLFFALSPHSSFVLFIKLLMMRIAQISVLWCYITIFCSLHFSLSLFFLQNIFLSISLKKNIFFRTIEINIKIKICFCVFSFRNSLSFGSLFHAFKFSKEKGGIS